MRPPSVSATMAKSEWDWMERIRILVGEWLDKGRPGGEDAFDFGLERYVAVLIDEALRDKSTNHRQYVCCYCGQTVQPPINYHEGECPA